MAEDLLTVHETLGSGPRTGKKKKKTKTKNSSSWVLKVCGFLPSCTNCVSIWNIDRVFPPLLFQRRPGLSVLDVSRFSAS